MFYTHIKVYVENREIGYLILHVKIFYPSILVYEKNGKKVGSAKPFAVERRLMPWSLALGIYIDQYRHQIPAEVSRFCCELIVEWRVSIIYIGPFLNLQFGVVVSSSYYLCIEWVYLVAWVFFEVHLDCARYLRVVMLSHSQI